MTERGLFIVFEGIDHVGKTTQAEELVKHFQGLSLPVKYMRFPDNESEIGKMLRGFLASKKQFDPRTVQLLFSANRSEMAPQIINDLESGTTIICDRYSYSGIAYGTVEGLDMERLRRIEAGFPEPDLILFLDMDVEKALSRHESHLPLEFYEKSDFQKAAQKIYKEHLISPRWVTVDASLSKNTVTEIITASVETCRNLGLNLLPISVQK